MEEDEGKRGMERRRRRRRGGCLEGVMRGEGERGGK